MKNTHRPYLVLYLAFTAAALFFSCKDDVTTVHRLEDIIFPDSNISYDRHVQPLFNIGCAITDCHDATTKAGDINLSEYYWVRTGNNLVVPFDTTKGRLLPSIVGLVPGRAMPPGKSLTLNQIRGLKRWVLEGATNSIP